MWHAEHIDEEEAEELEAALKGLAERAEALADAVGNKARPPAISELQTLAEVFD